MCSWQARLTARGLPCGRNTEYVFGGETQSKDLDGRKTVLRILVYSIFSRNIPSTPVLRMNFLFFICSDLEDDVMFYVALRLVFLQCLR